MDGDNRLGRHILSVILSFLEETEGCSLLICQKRWARQLLPIFRLKSLLKFPMIGVKHRHTFVVIPVQDASVRLERLNTKRLYKRQQKRSLLNKTTEELAWQEWNENTQTQRPASIPRLLRFLRPADRIATTSKTPSAAPVAVQGPVPVFAKGLTLLVSYPRSGNTLLRSLLEQVTGIVTGSDTRPDRTLSRALANAHGLVGEGVCSSTQTVFCKTHWPERIGCMRYTAERVIILVRNPFDAIDSYWNLNLTNTHTQKVSDQVYQDHYEFFENLVRNEFAIWRDFHQFWLSQSSKGIPLLVMRYEDLIGQPQIELARILKFSLLPGANDTNNNSDLTARWKDRIEAATTNTCRGSSYGNTRIAITTTQGQSGSTTSNNSSTGGGSSSTMSSIGRSLRRYSTELLQELHDLDTPAGLLSKFGYHVHQQGFPNNLINNCTAIDETNMPNRPLSENESKIKSESSTTTTSKTAPLTTFCSETSSPLVINNPQVDIRPPNCLYGRKMRDWRRRHTKDDTEPFPTVQSKK
jgi:hypothetical protein